MLGFCIDININPHIDIKLFEVINLNIDSKISKSYDKVYSGNYLVVGIISSVSLNGTFIKRLFLSRNGINLPDDVNFEQRNV